jgi:threonine aldolase
VHVDLRSDTVTRPTPAMRAAMASAEVGDDVFGDDPTVRALEAASAERAGKAAALFVPSGTQANLLAIAVQTRPGDEVMMHEEAHPFLYEGGGAAAIAGVQIRPLPGPRGLIDPRVIAPHVRRGDVHFAPTTLLCIEDTANRGGGVVHPLATLDAVTEAAAAAGLGRHLDGARAAEALAVVRTADVTPESLIAMSIAHPRTQAALEAASEAAAAVAVVGAGGPKAAAVDEAGPTDEEAEGHDG